MLKQSHSKLEMYRHDAKHAFMKEAARSVRRSVREAGLGPHPQLPEKSAGLNDDLSLRGQQGSVSTVAPLPREQLDLLEGRERQLEPLFEVGFEVPCILAGNGVEFAADDVR